jgi:hypothetical protein
VETGADVPGYSGGLAACAFVFDPDLLSPWVADPGRGAERFFGRGDERIRGSSFAYVF